MQNLERLILELINLSEEKSWLEFKKDNYKPDMIGEDISALANSATLTGRDKAYMIWGIDDKTHEIIGTEKDLQNIKVKNQELENWLRSLLSDNAQFDFYQTKINNKNIGVLVINHAMQRPVSFEKKEYIRVGSYTKKLKDVPPLQASLWDEIRSATFEMECAISDLTLSGLTKYIDYEFYFNLCSHVAQPTELEGIIHYLKEESFIVKQDNGLYSLTNLGAILFARDLSMFPHLYRKAVRVVTYRGKNKFELQQDEVFEKGYAIAFEDVMKYLELRTPPKEVFINGIRKRKRSYPDTAIRELLSNALIHQDFTISGAGPIVEIFSNRIEITNPGRSLVEVNRIIDNPPRSRNEKLAYTMRRLGFCEELGSGWDKIAESCEKEQFPSPKIETYSDSTRVLLFQSVPFVDIPMEDKLWACYLHACLKYIQGEQLTNSSLRERFGLQKSSSGSISRLIKEAVKENYIKPFNSHTAPRYMKYIPSWA
ncbi:MAG TPA: putative DNA binding domain-containing protein [Veillonellaceae bacterium]|nr:putative DNA binding domain-containing protein [Veillonellaceae bacterium]